MRHYLPLALVSADHTLHDRASLGHVPKFQLLLQGPETLLKSW